MPGSKSLPQLRQTTEPSITDSRALPQLGQRSARSSQLGSAAWHPGQMRSCRPPITTRAQGEGPLTGSV
jgi:hypothetical protein